MNIDDTQEVPVPDEAIEGQEAIAVDEPATTDTATEEPGETGDPEHGLPGEAEPMPADDAQNDEAAG